MAETVAFRVYLGHLWSERLHIAKRRARIGFRAHARANFGLGFAEGAFVSLNARLTRGLQ